MAAPSAADMLAVIKGAKTKFNRSSGKIVTLKEGKTRVRILPSWDPSNIVFFREVGVHWIKTELNGKPVAVAGCREIIKGETCPIDLAIEKASRVAPDDETLAIIKDWKPKKTVLVNACIRSGSEESEDPVPLNLPVTVFGMITAMMEEYYADYGNAVDPESGYDFTIERTGKGRDTEYKVMPQFKSKKVSKETLDKLHDLDALIEREYFRDGEERKALIAISNMIGIDVTTKSIGSSGASKTAALLTKATVEEVDNDVVLEEVEVSETEIMGESVPESYKPAAKPAPKAEEKPAPKAEKAADDFGADLPENEIEELLGELDGLTG